MDITIGGLTSQQTGAQSGSSVRSAQSYLPGQSDSEKTGNNGTSAFAAATSVSLSSASANRLTADQVVSAINESLSSTGISIGNVDPGDYTPEAVADRILARVGDLIAANAGSESEAREIFDKASEGIQKGLDDAREFLEGLGALNEQINGNINETEERLNEGLKSIEQRLTELFNSSASEEAAETATAPDRDEQVLQSQITQTAQASQAYAEAATSAQRNTPRYGTLG
ncbi:MULTISPECIES: DUF5610 domain-containing protein [Thalassospira]|uniref:DUF5610 domain-containing protein n=2 Tax=Thalassospira TaxID=168934 RepID=A0A367WBI1_9PROT|nr:MULTISPECIES: DUF5610 domain-containing protein [Thalassospira]MDG4718178.1 DUF5610 domain-containing protein [Thalassospira sp. FZY0004]RCK37941.1 hypothetical protein TH19_07940 [Thalassospira profundimaris]